MKKILLVEDDELNCDMLTRRLEKRGYSVVVAANGMEGVRAAREHLPDLILMDLGLPSLNGWDATRRIRAAELTRLIPVIALTAHVMRDDREQAYAAGADDYDTKPVDIERLIKKIDKLLIAGRPVKVA